MAELLDQLHVDVRAELEQKGDSNAQEVPEEVAEPAAEPELVERPDDVQESAAGEAACSIPAPEPSDIPGPSAGSQEHVQPPDITSTLGQSQPDVPLVGVEGDQRPADILDQVPLTDRPANSDSPGPTKPPRQFTVEPDIVASTKKPPPTRPPPPGGAPPPRPPPPSWSTLPLSRKQDSPRPSGLEGR